MRIAAFLFLFLISAFGRACGQKIYLADHPVYLDISKQYINTYDAGDSSIRTESGDQDTAYIKVFDFTPNGKMRFIWHDTVSRVIVSGQYEVARKLSAPHGFVRDKYRVVTSPGGTSRWHYVPVRKGKWIYYNMDGTVLKAEDY